MRILDFEFSLRELAGSMGDFGTLFPLVIGYIAVCGVDPAGLLFMMGMANIVTGIVYRLPVPIEPMKVLAVMAIAQVWSPSMICASAFAMGLVWLAIAATGAMHHIARATPRSVVRGIQVALGILLGIQALEMIGHQWILGIAGITVALVFRRSRHFPAAILLMIMGIMIMFLSDGFSGVGGIRFHMPRITLFPAKEVWQSLVQAGFAQVPLTAANAVIATAALISQYWPEKPVSESRLSWNMGVMNVISPFLGGMPMCHGAGGLAGQYYFGARTGGANIIEGVLEISAGLLFAGSIATLLAAFPLAILGAMMLMVGIELIKFARDLSGRRQVAPAVVTVIVSVWTNMALGYLAGISTHYLAINMDRKNHSGHSG